MSDIMRPIPFDQLMDWILTEKKTQGTIFGESRLAKLGGHARPIFGEKVESPVGPAAGPNTQLAQNIIAAYVTGARFFELKTVQKMDGAELSACVNKPCILAADEGYNCEWSTELTVPGAFDEYVKAWVACKLLAQEFGFGDPDGFVFNMSVGYDLEGIKGEKVDTYINNMKDASNTPVFQEAIAWAKANLDRFQHVDAAFVDSISPCVSRSVTESTLHGCPPAEIERIATHLITEKGLNTYIKCNPTLLGYEYARKTLDSLGFDYIVFDEHHFNEDLQWADAVPMLNRLIALAKERGVEFGVKLTNTFPVDVTRSELPSDEMYMSGRSLYPLTVSLAKRIADEFDGSLRISFSGGADALNVRSLVDAGIWPVTVATTLLKPGGYQHLGQIDEALAGIDEKPFSGVDPAKVAAIVDDALTNPRYRKPVKPTPERHVGHELPLIDCFTAPCREDCPIEQDIPGYLRACEEGRYADALNIILERNALPFTTGTICPHTCGNSCMRNYYEEHVHIREFKLLAAENGLAEVLPTLSARGSVTGRKVAVVGAGPAGLAAASFLSRAGVDVTVFERTGQLGGIVRHVIPGFRISDEAIDHDVELCSAYGATFKTGVEVTNARDLLDQGFTDVVVTIGAWAPGRPALRSGEALDAIDFLRDFKEDPAQCKLGSDVMLNRLIALAKERGVEFGVKLTNTFPVDVTRSELPSDEMYMSGRSLYPLTVSLAKRIADEFDGSLRISFSGGADALNVRSLVDAGIWPVTVATTLLKPGGYQHLGQIDEALAGIDEKPFSGVDSAKVAAIVEDALTNPRYRKPVKPTPERHVGHELPLIDCFTAPCREDCPIEQDIPGYLRACEEGRYADALSIILERNALPFTTGTICPHTCGNSCMRNYYEEHVHIREFKLLAAEKGLAEVLPTLSARGSVTGRKVAVVGAGPAGLATASFLSRAGVDVTVFERTGQLGGIVRHVIPGLPPSACPAWSTCAWSTAAPVATCPPTRKSLSWRLRTAWSSWSSSRRVTLPTAR